MIKKLTIVDGIIQDEYINGIPVYVDIIKKVGKGNVRTGIKVNKMTSTTTHNTGNSAPTATDTAHQKWLKTLESADEQYIGAALFVDEDSITQALPIDEVVYHSGSTVGNGTSISVEICESGNIALAEYNAQCLIASLNITLDINTMHTHKDWNDKNCPHIILDGGYWDTFKNSVKQYMFVGREFLKVPDWGKEAWEWAYDNGLNDGIIQNLYEIQHMVLLYNYHKKFILPLL